MSKHHSGKGDKEYTKSQKLSNENKLLKRELDRLRKENVRLTYMLDNLPEPEEKAQPVVFKKKKERKMCNKCKDGEFNLVTYQKLGEIWYYRICGLRCGNRTKGQKWSESVEE